LKNKKLLVTTAIEETWGYYEDILFLGAWCLKYNKAEVIKGRKYTVINDPWSDRKRREDAFHYTESLYKKIIPNFSINMNRIHNVNHSERYWEILCGPWLKMFISVAWHYWMLIDELERNSVDYTYLFADNINLISNNMNEFERMVDDDKWNYYFVANLINHRMSVPIKRLDIGMVDCDTYSNELKKTFKSNIVESITSFFSIFNGEKTPFISNSYLSRPISIILSFRKKIFPEDVSEKSLFLNKINPTIRNRIDIKLDNSSNFETYLTKCIPCNLPCSYVELYSALSLSIINKKWQRRPVSLLTAAEHWRNDNFKLFAANMVESGSKLKILSHGGNGKYKYSSFESYEFDICDEYFTWGWSNISKFYKGFYIKKSYINSIKRKIFSKRTHLMHIVYSQHRYAKFIDSTPSYEQYIGNYIDEQISFLNNLSQEILKYTVTKLSYDLGNNLEYRLIDSVPFVNCRNEYDDYFKLLVNSKIVVSTYNCTTFLESLFYDIPTIIFWNPDHWELSEHSIPYFDNLIECGVFHNTALSASNMINKIWDNVDDWWYSEEVRYACSKFRDKFCRDSRTPVNDFFNFIDA